MYVQMGIYVYISVYQHMLYVCNGNGQRNTEEGGCEDTWRQDRHMPSEGCVGLLAGRRAAARINTSQVPSEGCIPADPCPQISDLSKNERLLKDTQFVVLFQSHKPSPTLILSLS